MPLRRSVLGPPRRGAGNGEKPYPDQERSGRSASRWFQRGSDSRFTATRVRSDRRATRSGRAHRPPGSAPRSRRGISTQSGADACASRRRARRHGSGDQAQRPVQCRQKPLHGGRPSGDDGCERRAGGDPYRRNTGPAPVRRSVPTLKPLDDKWLALQVPGNTIARCVRTRSASGPTAYAPRVAAV